jgi:hypothetical protein
LNDYKTTKTVAVKESSVQSLIPAKPTVPVIIQKERAAGQAGRSSALYKERMEECRAELRSDLENWKQRFGCVKTVGYADGGMTLANLARLTAPPDWPYRREAIQDLRIVARQSISDRNR